MSILPKVISLENDYVILDLDEASNYETSLFHYFKNSKIKRALVLNSSSGQRTADDFPKHTSNSALKFGKIVFGRKRCPTTAPQDVFASHIEVCILPIEEQKELISFSYLREMKDRMPFLDHQEYEETCESIVKKLHLCKVLTIKCKNEIAVICVLSQLKIFGQPSDLVSWVWFDSLQTAEDRKILHAIYQCWLDSNCKADWAYAAIHAENYRSKRFFKKLGFRSLGVFVTV